MRLRRFQSWFTEREKDKVKMEKRAQPKPKAFRLQNKVMFQASRNRPTNEQKLQLLEQYDREKSINPGLTIKSFCTTRPGLNPEDVWTVVGSAYANADRNRRLNSGVLDDITRTGFQKHGFSFWCKILARYGGDTRKSHFYSHAMDLRSTNSIFETVTVQYFLTMSSFLQPNFSLREERF